MFDIGWSELLLIGIVTLIVIGPKELPGALRTLGQWMTKVRRMASEFQNQFQDAIREAELAELKKEVDEMAAKASNFTHFDPVAEMGRDLEKTVGDFPSPDQPPTNAAPATPGADAPSAVPPPLDAPSVTAGDLQPPQEPAAPAPDPAKPDAGRAA